jgi:outer membrane immunogenic protein
MKTLFVASVAFIALAGSQASAADMAVKAPPPVVTPVSDWTGFYIGGNIGYGWGNANNAINFAQSATIFGGAPFWTLGATDRDPVNGVIGGGQIGYNWQVGQYVYGLETDFQGSGQEGSRALAGALVPGAGLLITTPVPTTIAYTDRLEWLGTARGRLGFANGGWLFYATGGLAYGDIRANGSAVPAPAVFGANGAANWNQSFLKVGWTAGVGVEQQFLSHWSWKVEYLYVDLGNFTANGTLPAGNCYGSPVFCNGPLPFSGPGTAQAKFSDNIIRLGLNYKFDLSPVVPNH